MDELFIAVKLSIVDQWYKDTRSNIHQATRALYLYSQSLNIMYNADKARITWIGYFGDGN